MKPLWKAPVSPRRRQQRFQRNLSPLFITRAFQFLPKLTSNIFISSISARVGALSRIRGRDDGRGPGSDIDRSMHEVDLTLQGQVWARQGRDPNAEGRGTKEQSQKSEALTSEAHAGTHDFIRHRLLTWVELLYASKAGAAVPYLPSYVKQEEGDCCRLATTQLSHIDRPPYNLQ